MGIWIAAVCDAEEGCKGLIKGTAFYTGDDANLASPEEMKAPVLEQVVEYLVESEDWTVRDGKVFCPSCKPACEVCNGIDPDCAACEAR